MANDRGQVFVDPVLLSQAEQVCKQRLKNDPENRTVLRSLAEVYRKLGRLREAAAAYERLFQLDPEDHEAGYMQAVFGGKAWPQTPQGIRAAPFALLNDFLSREFHDSLVPFVSSVREKFSVVPSSGSGEYDPNVRQTLEYRGTWEGRRRFRDALVAALPPVIPRLHLPPFAIRSFEVQVRAYQDGNFFGIHQDAPLNSPFADRMLNFVYYFHRLPRPYSGGELLLFDSDIEADTLTTSRFTRVVPEDNSLIIFPCNYYHCVLPIHCPSREFEDSRFVINGHVHKRMEATAAVNDAVESVGAAES